MYYFIVNPSSGSGRGLSVWKNVKAKLDRRKIEYREFLLSKNGEARLLARGLSAKNTPVTVVVVGGDGTINNFISGLTSFRNITFGCIPTGSGNDFVRGLGLTKDPNAALEAILHPKKISPINIGCVTCHDASDSNASQNSQTERAASRTAYSRDPSGQSEASPEFYCAVSTGVGYDASVCYGVDHSRLKTMLNRFGSGKLVYLTTALRQLFTMKRQDLTITIDDGQPQIFKHAYFAAAMNLPYEGGGFMFCPEALPEDDQFDLFIASGISRLKILLLLPLAFFGKHVGFRGIDIIRCKKAEILSPEKLCLHTDGEIPGFYRHVTFSLKEEKLPVILR
jgi:YegS/Rv2252/BmrU family lipid kinase